jgi:hypothetical protein
MFSFFWSLAQCAFFLEMSTVCSFFLERLAQCAFFLEPSTVCSFFWSLARYIVSCFFTHHLTKKKSKKSQKKSNL